MAVDSRRPGDAPRARRSRRPVAVELRVEERPAGRHSGCSRPAPVARRARWLPALRGRDPGRLRPGAPHHRHRAVGAQAVRWGRRVAWLGGLTGALVAAPSALSAQSSDSLFAAGVRAYKTLEFDLAAWTLRRDLAKASAAGAPLAAR